MSNKESKKILALSKELAAVKSEIVQIIKDREASIHILEKLEAHTVAAIAREVVDVYYAWLSSVNITIDKLDTILNNNRKN